jgi:PIN domain nuclease of toxin-antitoxin system
MRYLIDTHIFLWWLNGNKELKTSTQKIIKDSTHDVLLSVATMWEISIKHAAGKLPLKTTLGEMISVSDFELLPITMSHILELETLPLHHKDPFDRILIAQARAENLTLITEDIKMEKYDLKIL